MSDPESPAPRTGASTERGILRDGDDCLLGTGCGSATTFERSDGTRCCDFCHRPVKGAPRTGAEAGPTAHDHGNCELCDQIEWQMANLHKACTEAEYARSEAVCALAASEQSREQAEERSRQATSHNYLWKLRYEELEHARHQAEQAVETLQFTLRELRAQQVMDFDRATKAEQELAARELLHTEGMKVAEQRIEELELALFEATQQRKSLGAFNENTLDLFERRVTQLQQERDHWRTKAATHKAEVADLIVQLRHVTHERDAIIRNACEHEACREAVNALGVVAVLPFGPWFRAAMMRM